MPFEFKQADLDINEVRGGCIGGGEGGGCKEKVTKDPPPMGACEIFSFLLCLSFLLARTGHVSISSTLDNVCTSPLVLVVVVVVEEGEEVEQVEEENRTLGGKTKVRGRCLSTE